MRVAALGRPASALVGVVLALLIGAGTSLVLATPSSAHTAFLESDPQEGARLDAPPSQVRLTFTEDLLPQFVVVQVQVDGEEPRELSAEAEGAKVSAQVPSDLGTPQGAAGWRVDYRVVAADGHPVTGSVAFDVVGASTAGPSTSAAPSQTPAGSKDSAGSEPTSEPTATTPTGWLLAGLAALVLVPAAALVARSRRKSRHASEPRKR